MATQAVEVLGQQLALNERWMAAARRAVQARERREATLCAGCREREARFRVEIERRQAVAARLARGWNAEQVTLPLERTLDALHRRRRRAQIAARHALGDS